MSFTDRAKSLLDWCGRGQIIVQILVALGLGTGLRAVVRIYTQLNPLWITPLWLLSSSIFLGLLVLISNAIKKQMPGQRNAATAPLVNQSAVTVSSLLGTPTQVPQFDAALFFRASYHSPMTAEVEKNIRLIARQNNLSDEAGFLCRFVGVGLVAYLHDMSWAYIFRSQILMLIELNRNGLMPASVAKPYYDQAANEFPKTYANYSFQQWLEFMKAHELIIQHPTQMLEITVRGKDFLKYLTHWGADPGTKIY